MRKPFLFVVLFLVLFFPNLDSATEAQVTNIPDILFDSGQSILNSTALMAVQDIAEILSSAATICKKVSVEGHTDSLEAQTQNAQQLSEERAQNVANSLVDLGISNQRLTVRGFGAQFPVAVNTTPEGRAKNRRVEVVIEGSDLTPCIRFPLAGKTPYNATVTTILDHSIASDGYYHPDGIIRAYDGEEGKGTKGGPTTVCYPSKKKCTLQGYKKDSAGTPFNLTLLINYDDLDSSDKHPPSKKNILWYDGHSGYDYSEKSGTAIRAATDGILCIATSNTMPMGGAPWRNQNVCPYGNDISINNSLDKSRPTSWDRWHMFYIVDSGSQYSTWYLHSSSLDAGVENAVMQTGYADVNKGDIVAKVGHWGLDKGDHLHFEVRIGNSIVIDPYGDGVQNILWETPPPQ